MEGPERRKGEREGRLGRERRNGQTGRNVAGSVTVGIVVC